MSPRLPSSVLVGGLLRKAEAEGGFGAVLSKGDPTAGSIIVLLIERGGSPQIMERILQGDGVYRWEESSGQSIENKGKIDFVPDFVARRRRFDPDLWVIELDVPSRERFAAEMNLVG